jgi:transposase
MQATTTIGLDIAKAVFQVHGIDSDGRVVVRRQLKRRYVLAIFGKLAPCLIGIEACATSHHGRRFDAWQGLVPKQQSCGGRNRLFCISKRGDRYLRTLIIHGARAALGKAASKQDPRSRWLASLRQRRHPNAAAEALANKNARIAWAMLAGMSLTNPRDLFRQLMRSTRRRT